MDGKGVWSSGAASSISAPLSVTAGTHRVTVIANDSAGASDSSVLALTAVNSSGVNVTISTPTNSATVGTPFTLKASSPSGVNGWYVYSDGVAVWHGYGSSISAALTLAAGTHQVLARAWNTVGAYGDDVVSVNVSKSSSIPVPPANALVYNHIEDMTGWGDCTACAANPADPTPPIAKYYRAQFQTTPSLSKSSTKFRIHSFSQRSQSLTSMNEPILSRAITFK